jgi:hypothetical protein
LAAADGVKGFGSSDCEHSTVEIVPAPSDTSAVAANETDFLLGGEVDARGDDFGSSAVCSDKGGISSLMMVDRTSRPGWVGGRSFTFKVSTIAVEEEGDFPAGELWCTRSRVDPSPLAVSSVCPSSSSLSLPNTLCLSLLRLSTASADQ